LKQLSWFIGEVIYFIVFLLGSETEVLGQELLDLLEDGVDGTLEDTAVTCELLLTGRSETKSGKRPGLCKGSSVPALLYTSLPTKPSVYTDNQVVLNTLKIWYQFR